MCCLDYDLSHLVSIGQVMPSGPTNIEVQTAKLSIGPYKGDSKMRKDKKQQPQHLISIYIAMERQVQISYKRKPDGAVFKLGTTN